MKKVIAVVVMSLFLAGVAFAGGTADEAKALIEKGVAEMKASGKDKAFADFSDTKGRFVDRDLYIFVIDTTGMTLAHGGNPKLVGKDMSELKDADGKFFIKDIIAFAKGNAEGWVDYKWTNPVSKKAEPKSCYVKQIDNLIFGCGIYK